MFEEEDTIKGFRSYIGINLSLLIIVKYVLVSLAQSVWTMHNIYKV